MTIKRELFVERLRNVLNEADFPYSEDERAEAFGKIFDVNPLIAERIIEGLSEPSSELLSDIADEFEVKPEWLAGDESEDQAQ